MARGMVNREHPGHIWLGETVHRSFGNQARREGFYSCRDSEAFEVFDMEYDYDIWEEFERWLEGKIPLSGWFEMMNFQEAMYPVNYNKLRCLENHDQPRIAERVPDERARDNLTAMLFFLKGTTMLYGGQEFSCTHRPSLFEKETFPRTGRDISAYLRKLSDIKHTALDADDSFCAEADDENDIAVLLRQNETAKKIGVFSLKAKSAAVEVPAPDGEYDVFSLKAKSAAVEVPAPDGEYENLIDGRPVTVKDGKLKCEGKPIIFAFPNPITKKY